ncbi:MAG: dynamin family protein [Roseburia sp.]
MTEYEEVNNKIKDIIEQISPYATEEQLDDIQRINDNFTMKIEDFYREGRKLNIGVIGRVKAGKSSFLNTLLFNGEEVLPKAATPKTATLTKMEYADENRIVVEFYSEEEWEGVVEDAKLGDKNEITESAKELVDMARDRGLDVKKILSEGTLDRTFAEYSDLINFLNNYVGENGEYTPLVKSVIIYMNREEFKDVSIVDTPGLNDPIPSRTQKTKEFIEVCDVVFFLSKAGSFLDVNDWELLCKQLPQKGVKKMILVASQYDLGIRDVLKKEQKNDFFGGREPEWCKQAKPSNKATNVEDAKKIVAENTSSRIREMVALFETRHSSGSHDAIIKMLKECTTPVLMSSRAHDMYVKEVSEYNKEERNDLQFWKNFIPEEKRKEEFRKIGNFDRIREIYMGIKEEKKYLLEQKQREFIPKVYLELKDYLTDVKSQMELKLEYLQSNDCDSLEKNKREFESKITAITADIAEVFGNTMEEIKQKKMDINKELRELSIQASKLETHTGTETHHGTNTTYAFKLGPIKLGRHDSSYSYTTTYTYLEASDALEQINVYGKSAASEIENVFRETVELKKYRRKLLETIIRNFDTSDDEFDANYFRIIVQKALNSIDFPEVHIDVSKELEMVGNQFSGEVRNTSDQDKFRNLLSVTVEKLYATIVGKVDTTISEFQQAMDRVEKSLADNILKQVTAEFESIKHAIEDKEMEIANGTKYIEILSSLLNKI